MRRRHDGRLESREEENPLIGQRLETRMSMIRRIRRGEGELFRSVRLTALKESPEAFGSTYESALLRSVESWKEQADGTAEGSDRATFLLTHEETPVGIVALYRDSERADQGEIIQLWIDPPLRGTGAAVELAEAVLEWARRNGFCRVVAAVFEGNHRSRGFLRKLGFLPLDDSSIKRDGQEILVKQLVR